MQTNAKEYLRVFRFLISVGSERFGVESARWEGESLVLTRGMERAPARTLPDLVRAGLASGSVSIVLLTGDGADARVWRVEFSDIVDRGPDLLHAAVGDVAREAVCLTRARAVEVTGEAVSQLAAAVRDRAPVGGNGRGEEQGGLAEEPAEVP